MNFSQIWSPRFHQWISPTSPLQALGCLFSTQFWGRFRVFFVLQSPTWIHLDFSANGFSQIDVDITSTNQVCITRTPLLVKSFPREILNNKHQIPTKTNAATKTGLFWWSHLYHYMTKAMHLVTEQTKFHFNSSGNPLRIRTAPHQSVKFRNFFLENWLLSLKKRKNKQCHIVL